jgi:endonuclease YncB( thermonuclease family)
MQRPPEYPENEERDERDDDLMDKVYGPSQDDIDRSWDGYESGGGEGGRNQGGLVWKVTIVVVSLVILASLSLGILGPLFDNSGPTQQVAPERVDAKVLRVIDGRTIVVDSGDGEQTVRLIGVQALDFGDPFFNFAQQVVDSWIGGKDVLLEADIQNGDGQGISMRYVYFDDVMINAALILNGLGRSATEHPNTRYDAFLFNMERQARESEVGIWDPDFARESESAPQARQALSDDSSLVAS